MSFKAISFILCLLVGLTASLNLESDINNPLVLINPSNYSNGAKVEIRFSFPVATANAIGPSAYGSNGLNYKQFIGVAFPPSVGSADLQFDQTSSPKWGCALTDGTNTYTVTPIQSVASPIITTLTAENNIAYCRLDDTTSNVPLKTGPGIIYKLTITLTSVKMASTNFLRTVTLFTSTSNNPEKMIIDSIPVLGTAALYGDFAGYSPKALDITNAAVSITQGPSASNAGTLIYPYNTFDVTLTLKATTFITAADHMIVFKYPTDTVSAATSIITSDAAASDTLQVALKGNLSPKTFGTDGLYLDGMGEDLIPNRQFKLTLKGWKSLDTNIGTTTNIQVLVYYKNTFSILSSVTNNIFLVTKSDITLTANHPEFWDVYEGGAWPIAFTFKTTNDLINGGWVVIQQSNTYDQNATAGNRITFVPSTCDFSGNDSSFDNSYGKRPSCYPMRTLDTAYTNTSSPYNGSGIFFFLKGTITANKIYKVTVWAFFDVCGPTKTAATLNVFGTTAYTNPKFILTINKTLNTANLNEDRFVTMPTGVTKQNIIAQSTATDFLGKCWNNMMFDPAAPINNNWKTGAVAAAAGAGVYVTLTAAHDTSKTAAIHYQEIFDWVMFAETADDVANVTAGVWWKDFSGAIVALTPNHAGAKYLYSTSNAVTSGSYFLIGALIPSTLVAASAKLWEKIAVPVVWNAAVVAAPGKWLWQFPAAWFVKGNGYDGANSGTCVAAWNFNVTTVAKNTFTGTNLIPAWSSSMANYVAANPNFIGAKVATSGTASAQTIDVTNSLLPPNNTLTGASNIVRLVSTFTDNGTDETRWKNIVITDEPQSGDVVQLAFFTSCVKWTSTLPTITSLYTYIDIQIKWQYIGSGAAGTSFRTGTGTTLTNMRFIKLFPETGVFQDFAKNPSTSTPTTNPFISHTIYNASTKDSICLLELSGSIIAGQKDTNSDTLVVWVFFGTLLETDYTDASATYPVAPLVSGINVYGLQSGQPIDMTNQYMTAGSVQVPILNQFMLNTLGTKLGGTAAAPNMASSSAYMWFMGSVLYFTSVTSTNLTATTEQAFFIPYYCPRYLSAYTNGDTVLKAHIFPLIMAAWMTTRSYSNITSLNTWIHYTDTVNLKLLGNQVNAATTTDVKKTAANIAAGAIPGVATLKWSPYTSTENLLYVYNGTFTAAGTATFCTGHSLFLSSAITIDSTVTTAFKLAFTGKIGVYNGTKTFYAFGKAFNKGVFYGLGDTTAPIVATMSALISTGDTASDSYYTGIKRPTVDSFVSGTQLVLTDRVGYSCAAVNKIKNEGLSNYVVSTANGANIRNFILDWNRMIAGASAAWITPTVSFDKTDVAKSDVAANFKVILSPPVAVPAGTILKFTANNNSITSNTVCGLIITSGAIASQCDNNSSTISCTVLTGGASFTVCCYNVVVSDPLSLATVIANFPADSGVTGISTYLTSDIYSAATQIGGTNPFSFVTSNSSATDIIGTKYASITNVAYSQVNQESGIGKVTFTINLPREPVRDMKLSILGDLSAMYITGNVPRCLASFTKDNFGSSWDNGDALIDTCSVNNIQSGGTPVVVTTKKMIYKCGGTYQKTIYISLWPILVVNYNSATVTKNFKVSLTLNSSDPIAFNTQSADLSLTSSVSAKPNFTGQWDTLCTVSSITPKIPGELADYQFDIDLDTNKASLTNSNPNEVTIFFPYQYYGSFIPNVLCYSTAMLNCSFTDEGILNIRFSTNLTVGSGKKISITIVGIPNPAIDGDYSFPCTVNNTNFSTGARINLITGSGKLTGGITTTLVTAQGNLRFLQIATPVTDKNPRNVSVHKFRVAFDNAIGLTALPVTIANTPVVHVYFPSNYKLAWYSTKPSATIDEYTSDANNLITKTSTISPASITQSGNRVTITLTQTSYTFATTWRYWDITITNIVNPTDTTIQAGPPTTQTTRPFFITLTNSNLTSLYKTYTNVNTYVSDALTTTTSPHLGFNRGNSFSFDNTKWVVDIYASASQLNLLTVKAGRYLQSYFNIKTNPSIALTPYLTTLSLTDQIFKTSQTNYSLSTSLGQSLGFYIGCPCGTAPGYYLVNFTSTDTTYFAALSPVVITVDTSSKGVISFQTPPTIPASGSVMIGIILSESNFDALNVNWSAADNSKNDDTAKITNVVISSGTITPTTSSTGSMSPVYSTFSITSSITTLGPQSFKTSDPNACFSWGGVNVISFNISGQTAIIPSSLDLASYFKYTNADTDTTITAKNAIKFNFTAPAAPIYLYCALACINMAYPADADIQVPKVANTNYLQFYSNIVSSTTPIDIVFSNLVRGMQYHMRCIIQSTQGDTTLRTSSSVNIENYKITGTTNTTTVNLQPSSPQATQCVQWQFLSEPGQQTRTAVVNYCQKLFSANGYQNSGCVICTYSDMSYVSAGLSLPTNITCPTTTVAKRLRFLQSTNVNPPNVTADVTTTLTVCPIAHPVCTSDVSGNKMYADIFNQLIADLKTTALFKSTLNIDNVRLNTTVPTITVTDTAIPDITKLVFSVTSSAANGAFSSTVQYTSPLVCFWQISDSATAPAFSALQGCSDASWCGKSKVGTTATAISTTNLKAFTAGSTYNVYLGCTNDIPMAQKQSAVKSMGTFTIPAAAVTPTPDNTTSTVTPTTSASFTSFSALVVMLLALLFI